MLLFVGVLYDHRACKWQMIIFLVGKESYMHGRAAILRLEIMEKDDAC